MRRKMLLLSKWLRLSRRDKKVNGLTYSQKKYLFAIYKLGQNGGEVKSSEVAKLVGVSKAKLMKHRQLLLINRKR